MRARPIDAQDERRTVGGDVTLDRAGDQRRVIMLAQARRRAIRYRRIRADERVTLCVFGRQMHGIESADQPCAIDTDSGQ
jgi:hypothetical protein